MQGMNMTKIRLLDIKCRYRFIPKEDSSKMCLIMNRLYAKSENDRISTLNTRNSLWDHRESMP